MLRLGANCARRGLSRQQDGLAISTLTPEPASACTLAPTSPDVRAVYSPSNGFCTISLLVTEVTPGTPFAISATSLTCEASVTVPLSVTTPPLATMLMLPALI